MASDDEPGPPVGGGRVIDLSGRSSRGPADGRTGARVAARRSPGTASPGSSAPGPSRGRTRGRTKRSGLVAVSGRSQLLTSTASIRRHRRRAAAAAPPPPGAAARSRSAPHSPRHTARHARACAPAPAITPPASAPGPSAHSIASASSNSASARGEASVQRAAEGPQPIQSLPRPGPGLARGPGVRHLPRDTACHGLRLHLRAPVSEDDHAVGSSCHL